MMEPAKDSIACEATKNISAEIPRIIPRASGMERLMPFVEAANGSHHNHCEPEQAPPIWLIAKEAIEESAKQAAAAEKKAEVVEFINVSDFWSAGQGQCP